MTTSRTAPAIEARKRYADERAIHDPAKLERAVRVFKLALEHGLVTPSGDLIDRQQEARDRAAVSATSDIAI